MKKNIRTLAALLIASATFVACSSDDNIIENQQPVNPTGKYTMTVEASKGGPATNRALSLDGKTLNATWAAGEQVTVYNVTKSAALGGYLEAQSAGASTTLKGALTGTVEAGDELNLLFLKPVYSAQNGTLAYIAANCDYAVATVTVASVDGDNITTAAAAAFANQQAIVKFKLQDADGNNLNATSLTISAASNKLVKGMGNYTKSTTHSGYTYDNGSDGYDGPSGLVDGSTDSKWCAGGEHKSDGVWYCEFHTASAVQVDGYTLTTGNDNSTYTGRNPKDWVLKAKVNSGDAWTTIATVANESTMEDINYTPYDFIVDNPGTYQYFRIEISSARDGGTMQLSELQLWEGSYSAAYGDLTVTPASATSEMTVALRNENGSADTYTVSANVGGKKYAFSKGGVTFQNGKYYEITVKMTEQAASTVEWIFSEMSEEQPELSMGYTYKEVTLSGNGGLDFNNGMFEASGGVLTFTAPSGKNFKSIVITTPHPNIFGSGWTNNNGNGTSTWTGNASKVTIGAGSNAYDVTSIVFTLE